ncbi:RNA polymerase sigma factor [Planctomycetota bacterium]
MAKASEQIIDEILVIDCQAGRAQAMEALVSRWQKRLWQHAYRLVGDVDAAWDVTQQSWLAIIKGIRKLHDPAHFKAWAYRITTNKAVDWIKRDRRTKQIDMEAKQDPTSRVAHDLDARELLAQLDLKKRVVLNLYYFEQLNISEISHALRIPPGTVKSRLHNAKKELKQIWEKTIDE